MSGSISRLMLGVAMLTVLAFPSIPGGLADGFTICTNLVGCFQCDVPGYGAGPYGYKFYHDPAGFTEYECGVFGFTGRTVADTEKLCTGQAVDVDVVLIQAGAGDKVVASIYCGPLGNAAASVLVTSCTVLGPQLPAPPFTKCPAPRPLTATPPNLDPLWCDWVPSAQGVVYNPTRCG
jgi:hypothetical protein